jgi:hypothetical protein
MLEDKRLLPEAVAVRSLFGALTPSRKRPRILVRRPAESTIGARCRGRFV